MERPYAVPSIRRSTTGAWSVSCTGRSG